MLQHVLVLILKSQAFTHTLQCTGGSLAPFSVFSFLSGWQTIDLPCAVNLLPRLMFLIEGAQGCDRSALGIPD